MLWVGHMWHTRRPRALGLGEERVDALADASVDDAGDIAGAGEVAGLDGRPDDLGGVQAGQLGGVEGPEQPPRLR